MEKRKGAERPAERLPQQKKIAKEPLVDRNEAAVGSGKSKKSVAMINPNAGRNKGNVAEREKEMLRHVLCEEDIHITTKEEMVKDIWRAYMENPMDLVFLSGGDGTAHKFITINFLENYRRFEDVMTLPEFGHEFNNLALDPRSGVCLPVIYPKPQGTVNFLAELLETKGDLMKIANSHMKAKSNPVEMTTVLDVAYIPVLMLYSKEHPYSTENVQLMTVYGDGFTFYSVNEYEKFKENWRGLEMGAALEVVLKGSVSAVVGLMLDKILGLIYGSTEKSRKLYPKRFIETLVEPIEGEVKVDDRILPTDTRAITLIGTHWMNSQGIKPFWRMPQRIKDMETYFPAGVPVNAGLLDPKDHTFHYIGGKPNGIGITMGAHRFFSGRQTHMQGLFDMEAKRVEMKKRKDFSIIADGTRHHKLPPGETLVIEVAYLQPFVCNS